MTPESACKIGISGPTQYKQHITHFLLAVSVVATKMHHTHLLLFDAASLGHISKTLPTVRLLVAVQGQAALLGSQALRLNDHCKFRQPVSPSCGTSCDCAKLCRTQNAVTSVRGMGPALPPAGCAM